jgi:hypothetical protein
VFGLRLIPNARKEMHRLWSIRVALFLGVLNGAVLGLAAFMDVFNPWLFMGLNVFGYGLLASIRLVKQADPPAPGDAA